jgi:hypothetical protein
MKASHRIGLMAAVAAAAACGGSSSSNSGGGGGGGTREWTVMVYMAADNNLAVQGVLDLDEMEDAGINDKVQVVVQAEFSPTTLQQYGCNSAACVNRPNFNTFRYAITQAGGSAQNGPDRGTVSEISGGTNVDMTDPGQLQAFVQWAKTNYPANHYLLVLWNHGGGYTGLIQDETSGGSGLMSLEDLKAALTGVGPVDIIDFDMCLMAGYETLAKIAGLADFAVFSEEVVPGEGNPYTSIIDGIQANPTQDARTLSGLIVDRFNASYQGNKASTTISAYDLSGFATFETALNALAADLQAGLPGLGATISTAAAASQKYTITELTDLVNFLDTLNTKVPGQAALQAKIAALRTEATAASFRINTRARTGSGQTQGGGVTDVSRSTGLNIVLPSGTAPDVLPQSGNGSLAAYQALLPGKPWTAFLAAYAGSQIPVPVTDQGSARFETYLVWESAAVTADADVDFWVLEPDGNIYLPAFGSVTPNGTMSNDSYADRTNFEGYLTNRFVEKGDYLIFANLWRDPVNFQPAYELAYRYDQTANFDLLFQGNGVPNPVLSLQTSWLNDPTPTLAEVVNGSYTDLQFVAVQSFAGPPAPLARRSSTSVTAVKASGRSLTSAQIATLQRLVTLDRLGGGSRSLQSTGLWQLPFGAKGAR